MRIARYEYEVSDVPRDVDDAIRHSGRDRVAIVGLRAGMNSYWLCVSHPAFRSSRHACTSSWMWEARGGFPPGSILQRVQAA